MTERDYQTQQFTLPAAFPTDRAVTGNLMGIQNPEDATGYQHIAFSSDGVRFEVWTTLEGIELLSTSLASFARDQRAVLKAAA